MSVQHPVDLLGAERLGPDDLIEVVAFLDADPVTNVYLLALAMRDGLRAARDEWWGVRRAGRLEAVLYLGLTSGAVLPVGGDVEALRAVAERVAERVGALPRRWQVIGPRGAVRAIVARLQADGHAPRLSRRQIYMSVTRAALVRGERLPELRPARPEDYALVHDSGAALRAEELDEDPRQLDPLAYARRVEEECRDGYTWVWIEAGRLRFRASVSALTSDAVQVSGVYTPPEFRNRGFARCGLTELVVRMLDRTRAAALFVNDFNAPAIAVYRRIGFTDRAEWASAFYGGR
ncbi:MAG TPA: GNAT family N-acetyltransferase [Candidatus Eisenbacteria bacterium]|nr:GNAT family N-acetyltransferase [Candidatus Eisenbacteria bacterium]